MAMTQMQPLGKRFSNRSLLVCFHCYYYYYDDDCKGEVGG